jgi:sugar transferase (PEP-CTERM/EpsH1 system associated)
MPFPPNKGDKVRSFNLLKFLSARFRVHLGTFIDDPDDLQHVTRILEFCASSHIARIRPRLARMRSLVGLATNEPLTMHYYRDATLARWVNEVVREEKIATAVIFSSAMAQYVDEFDGDRVVVDFVDVDSAKWTMYGKSRQWPLSALYRREGLRMLAFERAIAARIHASVFVTPAEADLFRNLAPESAPKVHCAQNGVDVDYFDPAHELSDPFPAGEESIVFTGAMDYWPNVDAVSWFAREVMPLFSSTHPHGRFYIVGMHPTPSVLALASDPRVIVTGLVPDVRPYLKHAKVVVAPLRVARGIQNKVLEAMAMERPVVVSGTAAEGLTGVRGIDFETATTAEEYALTVARLTDVERGRAMGKAARRRVISDYSWDANLAPFAALLDDGPFKGYSAG